MKRTLLLMALLAFAAGASAQTYKWVDRNGRVQYGDTPPPGANAAPLRTPSGRAAPAQDPEESAKKGPRTLAERDAEFRKRREEADKEQEKQAKAAEEARDKKENCARAQAALRTLESGQRIARTNAAGERIYLEDAEIAQETVRARQVAEQWCN